MTELPDPPARSPVYRAARAVGRFLVVIVVVGYSILDTVLFPLFRPLIRWLSGLRLFEAIGALIVRLPPYVVLLILAVPFIVLEPLKVFALYWFALGHLIQGGILLIVSAGQLMIATTLMAVYSWQLTLLMWVCFLPLLFGENRSVLPARTLIVPLKLSNCAVVVALKLTPLERFNTLLLLPELKLPLRLFASPGEEIVPV